jgi:hypothetical protein
MFKRSFDGRSVYGANGVLILLVIVAVSIAGCTGSGGSGSQVPPTAGDVWEIDPAAGRPSQPGAVLAYVNGLHVIVLNGSDAYVGMTPVKTGSGSNGLSIKLSNGLEAVLTPSGEGRADLRFSTGESIGMRKRVGR